MDCVPCLAGTYSTASGSNSSSTCLTCPAGTYSGPATSECLQCSAGKYSSTLGSNTSASCLSCPAKSTSPAGCTNASFCSCKAGYKNIDSVAADELVTTDSVTCVACEAGKYKEVVGSATSCQDCRRGTSSKIPAADNSSCCVLCPTGETNNKSGATECDCMQDFTRDCETKVSLRLYVCVCTCENSFVFFIQTCMQSGHVSCDNAWVVQLCKRCKSYEVHVGGQCQMCPDSAICDGSALLLCKTGFYHTDSPKSSGQCQPCPDSAICDGSA